MEYVYIYVIFCTVIGNSDANDAIINDVGDNNPFTSLTKRATQVLWRRPERHSASATTCTPCTIDKTGTAFVYEKNKHLGSRYPMYICG